MTKQEVDESAALVVRLRKELEHTNQHLVAHIDALTKSNAQCGEYLRHNEMLAADRATLHRELVDARAALASVTEQRDSLRRTLDEWERGDTKPHERVTADDVADHVVPPVLDVGEPDPANNAKDAALEFRNVVPTPEMIKHVGYWDLVSGAAAIAFKPGGLSLVFWRISGSQEWRTDPCPQPLKPHGMTWQQLDNALANQQPVPMCTTCHGCGSVLYPSPAGDYFGCGDLRCTRSNTKHWHPGCTIGPYAGPCKSATPVRHE